MQKPSETFELISLLLRSPRLDTIAAYRDKITRASKRYAMGFYAIIHTFTHIASIHTCKIISRVQWKSVHFLSLNTIRNTYSTLLIHTGMHTDTVELPFLASQRPLWQPRGRAQGSRPASPPAAPRSAHLPAWGPEIAPITEKWQQKNRTGRSF